MEVDYKAIGRRIKNKRIEKNLTQEKLGELIGMSGKYIGNIERGEGITSIKTFILIVNALETSADKILADNVIESKVIYDEEVKEILENLTHGELKIIIEMMKSNREAIRKAINCGKNEKSKRNNK